MTQHIPTRLKMFNPNFRYTNEIVRLLTKISASREILLNSPLIPKWEVTLRREAIIHSAHTSTRIEGNRLSLDKVSDLECPSNANRRHVGKLRWLWQLSQSLRCSWKPTNRRDWFLTSGKWRGAEIDRRFSWMGELERSQRTWSSSSDKRVFLIYKSIDKQSHELWEIV